MSMSHNHLRLNLVPLGTSPAGAILCAAAAGSVQSCTPLGQAQRGQFCVRQAPVVSNPTLRWGEPSRGEFRRYPALTSSFHSSPRSRRRWSSYPVGADRMRLADTYLAGVRLVGEEQPGDLQQFGREPRRLAIAKVFRRHSRNSSPCRRQKPVCLRTHSKLCRTRFVAANRRWPLRPILWPESRNRETTATDLHR